MTGELRDYYMVEPGDIVECGVPHFDEHTRPRTPAEMGDLLRGLALSPDHPYLFFGMSSPYFAPREIDIVEWLAARVERGELGDGLQMVVRPHPQNMTGWMSDQSWKGRLQALEGKRVAVDYPSVEPSRLSWNMQRADLAHLARLISGCTVSINSGSTLSIDAIVQDKPVILSCFDAADELPWWESARRVLEYPHLAKLVALGGVYPTRSLDELAVAITAYLADPSLHADGRARTRREECGECDGQASRRSAAALAGLLHRGSTAQARA